VLLVLLVLPLLRGPQGERKGDVVVCSRMSSTMGNMIRIRTGGGEDETRRHPASGQVSERQGRSNVERERKRKGPMGLMPPGVRGGAVAAKAAPKADITVT
jgi:hypothetical protein